MIKFDADEAHIRMFVNKDGISRKIDMHLKKSKPKGIAIDGIPIRKASELFGLKYCVFLSRGLEYYQKRSGRKKAVYGFRAMSA